MKFASVELLISKSYNSGETIDNLIILFINILFIIYDIRLENIRDKIINKSYKYIDLLLIDSSLIYFFFLKL